MSQYLARSDHEFDGKLKSPEMSYARSNVSKPPLGPSSSERELAAKPFIKNTAKNAIESND